MKTLNLSIFSILMLLVVSTQQLFAQPPPPTPPSGVPFDGGVLGFLVMALVGGAWFLSRK